MTQANTLAQLVQQALDHHRSGDLPAAEALYRRAVAIPPPNPDVLRLYGLLKHQQGDLDAAAELVEQALSLRHDHAETQVVLGRIRNDQRRMADAERAFRAAVALDPGSLDAHHRLAALLEAQGRWFDADRELRAAIAARPDAPAGHHRLGQFLVDRPKGGRRRVQEGEGHFRQALALALEAGDEALLPDLFHDLAQTLYLLDRHDEAADVCRQWLARQPDAAVARHMLASFSHTDVPARASDDYVRKVFDDFADKFDDRLVKDLQYRAPQLLVAAMAARVGEPAGTLDVLDAGCGTGLSAPLLRPFARRLVGVDLSPGMVEKARLRGGYDQLEVAELTAYLRYNPAAFDVVLSADTLIYFGDMAELLRAARGALRDGGWLVFSAESWDGDGFDIGVSGRYRHSPGYMHAALTRAGFTVTELGAGQVRNEGGQPVDGLIIVAQAVEAAAVADAAPLRAEAAPVAATRTAPVALAAGETPDLSRAIALLQQGQPAAAQPHLEGLLQHNPDHADALHFLGLLRQQQGHGDEAVRLIGRALALQPQNADAWFNLATLHAARDEFQQALDAYVAAMRSAPAFFRAYVALAELLERLEQPEQAIVVRRRLFEQAPGHPGNAHRLALLLTKLPDRDTPELEEAVACFRVAADAKPDDVEAARGLLLGLYTLKRHDEAADACRLLLARAPDDAFAQHMLAAFGGADAPARASDAYVRTLFEHFSARFDDHLVDRLAYHGPETLLALLTRCWPAGTGGLDILDAGCGTGLCAPLLRPFARTLTGIDLAFGMIERSMAHDEYDRLEVIEITRWVQAQDAAYDLVWVTDTFIYFGQLLEVLAGIAGALRERGWLAFTVEQMPDDRGGPHELDVNGRYRHARGYLEQVLDATGFGIEAIEGAPLRQERGQDVLAWYVVARRRDGSAGGGVSVANPRR